MTVQVVPASRRGLLVAAEGLDGSGTSESVESLARWLESRGRRVQVVAWQPSRLMARAASSARGRHRLTPRVAALLACADAARFVGREVAKPLAQGNVVLCDRYAWTAVAREIARGLDPGWVSVLYRFAPRPDLVILHRQSTSAALASALSGRPEQPHAAAVAGEYGTFLERMAAAYESLAGAATTAVPDRGRLGPWPAEVLVLDRRTMTPASQHAVRAALLRLFADALEPVVA